MSSVRLRLPTRFHGATIAGLDPKCGLKEVINYDMEDSLFEGRGLVLSGAPGVGKTWAMAALTKRYVAYKKGYLDYEFTTAPDFFSNITASEYEKAEDPFREQSWIWTYQTVPWLVVNDLGKEYRGGKLAQQVPYSLGSILRERSEKQKVTHFTTNLTGAGIRDEYGESIKSLLSEMTTFVRVTGQDRRVR